MRERLQRWIIAPLMAQLTQGATPQRLALRCALGVVIGLFPIFGITTTLCLVVGVALKVNQPAIQISNQLMAAPQLIAIPFLINGGRWTLGLPSVSLDPRVLIAKFWADIPAFLSEFGAYGLQGILCWALVAPALGFVVYQALLRVFSRWRAGARGKVRQSYDAS